VDALPSAQAGNPAGFAFACPPRAAIQSNAHRLAALVAAWAYFRVVADYRDSTDSSERNAG